MKFNKIFPAVFILQIAAGYVHGQNANSLTVQAGQALVAKDYTQAIKLYSEVIQSNPQYDAAYAARGDAFLLVDKRDAAIKDFSNAIRLNPTNYLAYQLRGSVYYENQEFEKAIVDLTIALQAEPQSGGRFKKLRGSAFKIRGECYSWQRDYTNAIADLTEALKYETNDYTIYERRGISFYGEKESDKALSDFNEAIRLKPEATESRTIRGRIYARTEKYTNAVQDFSEVIKQEPEAFQVFNMLAWVLATCPDGHVRDGKRAVELATKACELSNWEIPGCIDTLAAAYAEAGDFENAVKYQKQAAGMKDIPENTRTNVFSRIELYQQRKPYHISGKDYD